MTRSLRFLALAFALLAAVALPSCQEEDPFLTRTLDFQSVALPPESYWNGADGDTTRAFGEATLPIDHTDWGGGFYSWFGFAYSNVTDTATRGLGNQYSARVATPRASNVYAVVSVSAGANTIRFCGPVEPQSVLVTNSTYAYHSMRHGDQFAKRFGGPQGTDPDWFRLTVSGLDALGAVVGSVDFYLADYRTSAKRMIGSWTRVDLTPLGQVSGLSFQLASSDVGEWGMNTPAYFCLDNLVYRVY